MVIRITGLTPWQQVPERHSALPPRREQPCLISSRYQSLRVASSTNFDLSRRRVRLATTIPEAVATVRAVTRKRPHRPAPNMAVLESFFYSPTRDTINFWGYNQSIETLFSISTAALQQLAPGTLRREEALLAAFDRNRERILEAATRIYGRGRLGVSYDLNPTDF